MKARYLKSSWYSLFGLYQNVFTTNDPLVHRQHRKLLAAPMAETAISRVAPLIDQKVQLTIRRMSEEMKTRGSVDIAKWWLYMATDVIAQLSFGSSFEMLERGKVGPNYMHELPTGC